MALPADSMRAVAYQGTRALVAATIPVPDPGPGQVLLQVAACGICGSDLHMYEVGALPSGSVLGHEFCGRVVAAGEGARLHVGDRCVGWPLLACRRCAHCTAGLVGECEAPRRIGLGGSHGAYAEYVLVDSETALPVPDSLDDATAAMTEPLTVGLHAVRISRIRPGDSCAVIGAGCIGLMVLQCVLLAGAVDAVVVEPASQRAEAARLLGATQVFASGDEAWQHCAAHPIDVALECAGAPGTLQLAADLVRRGGEVIGVGVTSEDRLQIPAWLVKELTLRMAFETRDDFPRALRLLADGRVRPAGIVSRRARLEELPDLFASESGARREVKVVCVPN
jgi:(R,R)-butanediol dehydrogenase / meso-butanediol dehydrogenase / diacetyl reductase